jgi:lipopolysaccharide transport system permease protein
MLRNIEELYRFRALVWALTLRHIRSRYRGSVLGFVWSFLNPLFLMAVYTLVFQYYIRFETKEFYPTFLLTGLLPWLWFTGGVLDATSSISSGGNLITKAMFPPQVLPAVAVLTHFVNFLFALPVLVAFLLAVGTVPGMAMLLLPLVFMLQIFVMLGISFLLSSLNVMYRDIQHVTGNLFTLMFFVTPVLYPLDTIPEKHRQTMLVLNPMAPVSEMYRQIVLYDTLPSFWWMLWVLVVGLILFAVGNLVFNRYREQFAECV